MLRPMAMAGAMEDASVPSMQERAKALGVTIEAQYTVGEYDILILSAKGGRGLPCMQCGRFPSDNSEI